MWTSQIAKCLIVYEKTAPFGTVGCRVADPTSSLCVDPRTAATLLTYGLVAFDKQTNISGIALLIVSVPLRFVLYVPSRQ